MIAACLKPAVEPKGGSGTSQFDKGRAFRQRFVAAGRLNSLAFLLRQSYKVNQSPVAGYCRPQNHS